MKKIYILTLLLCFISFGNSFAQTLKGHIYDAKTNEPLVGAAATYRRLFVYDVYAGQCTEWVIGIFAAVLKSSYYAENKT